MTGRFTLVDRLVYMLTARRWNKLISVVLCQHYEKRFLTSEQMHQLASEFDPTQQAAYFRISEGSVVPFWARPIPHSTGQEGTV